MRNVTLTSLTFVHNRLKRGTAKKPVSVEIRFTCGGKRKYLSTGIKVTPGQWSSGKVVRCKDSDELNRQLGVIMDRARAVCDYMNKKGIVDLDMVPSLMQGEIDKTIDFITYCEKRSQERHVSEHTKARYKVFIDFLKEWGQIKDFSDITVASVRSLDEYLHSKGYKQSTIYCYHKQLKLFVRDAYVDELISKNPYDHLKMKIDKGENLYVDFLPFDKFESIKNLHLEVGYLIKARDLFLLQCYTGLAYSDLMAFDFNDCVLDCGKYFYQSKRTKTNVEFSLQLLDGALKILKKYDYKIPQISNQKYNEYLKVIGHIVNVPNLHSHMGRATAATLFLSNGMPLNVVAKVLGHTNIRQTQRYARTLNKDVRSAFDNLEGKI